MRISSGCVETVALYEVDLPEELVRVFITDVNFFLLNTLQVGVEGSERKEEGENNRAEYYSIFMSTISRRNMASGAL